MRSDSQCPLSYKQNVEKLFSIASCLEIKVS